jgi:hypothetical protein
MDPGDSNIQLTISAIDQATAKLNQTLAQLGKLDAANAASIATQQKTNAAVNAGAAAFSGMSIAITAAAGASVLFTKNILSHVDALAREAKSLETTTEKLSALKFAMEQSRISAQESAQMLNQLQRAMSEASGNPASRAAQVFKTVAIALDGLDRRDVRDVMLQLSDAFATHSGAAAKAADAQILFGRSSRDIISFLDQGSQKIKEQEELFGKLGGTVKTLTADQVQTLNKELGQLKAAFDGVALELLDTFLPTLNQTAAGLVNLISATKPNTGGITGALRVIREEFARAAQGLDVDSARIDAAIKGVFGSGTQQILPQGPPTIRGKIVPPDFLSTDFGPARGNHSARLGTDAASFLAGATTLGDFQGPPLLNPEAIDAARKQQKLLDQLQIERLQEQAAKLSAQSGLRGSSVTPFAALGADQAAKDAEENETFKKHQQEITDLALITDDQRNALLEASAERHKQAILKIEAEGAKAKEAIRDKELAATSDFLGNLAAISKSFGKEGFIAFKALASAKAVIDGIGATLGAYKAGQDIGGPIVGGIFAAAAAGAVAAQIAQLAATNPSFSEGGYSGPGGVMEPAGTVHKGEIILPQRVVKQFGIQHFNQTYFAGRMPAKFGGGFATGGLSLGSIPTANQSGAGVTISMARIESRNDMRQWLAEDGLKIIDDGLARKGRFRV